MATNPYLESKFNSPQLLKRANSMGSLPTRRITGVKVNQIYNPQLPSLRRIEMDHILGKLPYEHCRATTWLSKEHFDRPTVKVFEDRQFHKRVYRGQTAYPERLPRPQNIEMRPSTTSRAEVARAELEALANRQENFSKYLTANLNANPLKDRKVPPPLRYAQTFKQDPSIDWRGQMPVPARALDKHREFPNFHRDVSNAAWK